MLKRGRKMKKIIKKPVVWVIAFLVLLYCALLIVHAGMTANVKTASDDFVSDDIPYWGYEKIDPLVIESLQTDKDYTGKGECRLFSEEGKKLYIYDDSYLIECSAGKMSFDALGYPVEFRTKIDTDKFDTAFREVKYSGGKSVSVMTYKDGVPTYYSTEGKRLASRTDCDNSPKWLCTICFCSAPHYYDSDFKRISAEQFDQLIK